MLTWQKLVDGRRLSRRHPRPVLDDIALLQYTSGTTGTPKGAILTHRNLRANAMQGRAWVPGLHEGEETFYGVLPLFHAYGMTLCLTFAMSIGAKLVLFPKYDAKLVADAAKKSPPTFLPAVPPIYDQLARSAEHGEIDLKSVRFAISGAMSLPVETVARWEEATGGLLVEGYGMTETSPVALGNPIGPSRRPGTVGVPFPSTEIRVVDPADTSVDRPFGESGELLIRGPQVFQGYWRRPTETAESLLAGGWVRTGDIVTVSPDGFVTVVDRLKEIIITGGFNVAPTEVEEALHGHPDVVEAAVVGSAAQGRRGGRGRGGAARGRRAGSRGAARLLQAAPGGLQGAAQVLRGRRAAALAHRQGAAAAGARAAAARPRLNVAASVRRDRGSAPRPGVCPPASAKSPVSAQVRAPACAAEPCVAGAATRSPRPSAAARRRSTPRPRT